MKILIDLVQDTLSYNKESKSGTLNGDLFGVEDFTIYKSDEGEDYLVNFGIDLGSREAVWTFPCTLMHSECLLVVDVECS